MQFSTLAPHVLADGLFGFTDVQLALAMSAVAIIFLVRRWRRNTVSKFQPKNSSAGTSRRAAEESANPLTVREVAAEVQALLADLEETSRRLTAQLDNRYTRLEQLLAEADGKIRRLETLSHANTQDSDKADAEVELTPSPFAPAEVAKSLTPDAQTTLSRLRHERGAPPAAQDPAYQPIYSLADHGKSSREIAQQLGRQPGEIELILALRHG